MKKFKKILGLIFILNIACFTIASASTNTDYAYDKLNRLVAQIRFIPSAGGESVSVTSYSYDEIGNISSRENTYMERLIVQAGNTVSLNGGKYMYLSIFGVLANGQQIDITKLSNLVSNNTCVVEATGYYGQIYLSGAGIATVTATYLNVTGSVTIDVNGTEVNFYPGYPVAYLTGGQRLTKREQTTVNAGDIFAGPFVIECGAKARFIALDTITLKPGFHAISGSTFSAKLENPSSIQIYSPAEPSTDSTFVLSAMGNLSTGPAIDITNLASWQSTNTCIATVGAGGNVVANGAGLVNFIATYRGVSQMITVNIAGRTPSFFPLNNPADLTGSQIVNPGEEANVTGVSSVTAGPFTVKCGGLAKFTATNAITLKPGFHAEAGSTFSAAIAH